MAVRHKLCLIDRDTNCELLKTRGRAKSGKTDGALTETVMRVTSVRRGDSAILGWPSCSRCLSSALYYRGKMQNRDWIRSLTAEVLFPPQRWADSGPAFKGTGESARFRIVQHGGNFHERQVSVANKLARDLELRFLEQQIKLSSILFQTAAQRAPVNGKHLRNIDGGEFAIVQ
jgi:hypothetical protein